MKTTFQLFLTFLLFVFTFNKTQAQLQNLTYDVRAANFAYYDSVTFTDPLISGLKNVIEFDIYIQQTNVPADDSEIMRFAIGQYYINLNFGSNIASPSAADTTGYAKFSYIAGSSTFTNLTALPTNPHVKPAAAATDGGAYYPPNTNIPPTGIRGGYINLNSNIALGNTSNVQISGSFPGTKVGRYRLRKNVTASWPSPYFASVSHHFRWRIAPGSNPNNPSPRSKIFAYNGLGGASTDVTNKGTFIIDTTTINIPAPMALNIKVLIEGVYYPIFNQTSRKDSIKVYLRNITSPYEFVDSVKGKIDSLTFSNLFTFRNASSGKYYIVVKNFNCIETWSRDGGDSLTRGGLNNNYDFTDSASKAYGSNLKLKGSKYCLISGNVNQDFTIDASDISAIENDVAEGVTGYISTDLNGDYFVDAEDLSIVDNNKDNGVIVVTP